MVGTSFSLPSDYWINFELNKHDLEFLSNYLFEREIPLTETELLPVLLNERIRIEHENMIAKQLGGGKVYLPKEHYKVGETLVFPSMDLVRGKIINMRSGISPDIDKFNVIEVEFEDGSRRQFAMDLENHKLNASVDIMSEDQPFNQENITKTYGQELVNKLNESLKSDKNLVYIAGRWCPRSLLLDVTIGHLNLAEAVLEDANGKPLPISALLMQVEYPANINSKLVEFSMNYAFQEDGRFDEVGPAGEVLWCLNRLEPENVQKIPTPLLYQPINYDRQLLSKEMLVLESELDDELSESQLPTNDIDEVMISLIYPHWRAGTLPVSARLRGLFPSAYESPRVRFTFVDGQTNEEMPGWLVREHHYVYGLRDYYNKYSLIPGSIIELRRAKKSGHVIIRAKTCRPTRDWVRTVLVGSDGGIVFAMLKQKIMAEYNERMVAYIVDLAGIDHIFANTSKQQKSFDKNVKMIMRELTKLNIQGHIHAQELYSALNIIWRCPPAPLFAFLINKPEIKYIGDLHFKLIESVIGHDE